MASGRAASLAACQAGGPLAQRLEQSAHNRLVVGSNPTGPTIHMTLDPAALTAAGKIAPLAADAAEGFLKRVFGPSAESVGLLLADRVNERRHANLIRIVTRAQRRLAEAGISPRQVPLKIIQPLIEHASLEESEDLQKCWSQLLASAAADPDSVHPAFVRVLSELSGPECRLLQAMYDGGRRVYELEPAGDERLHWIRVIEHNAAIGVADGTLTHNPKRLGLMNIHDASRGSLYYLTAFGATFVCACSS